MGRLIAIDKLYMNKIPNSCKECPLTYLDTGDDAYFGSNERRCVIDDSCVDGMGSERAYDCPLVEAIPKDQYEARLKADMVAMLEELDFRLSNYQDTDLIRQDIQQKINALKGEQAAG